MPLEGRRSRRSGTPAHQKPRGRSQSKNHRRQKVSDQSTSSHSEEEEVEQVSKPVREGWCKGCDCRERGCECREQGHECREQGRGCKEQAREYKGQASEYKGQGREYKGQGIEYKRQCHTSGESSDDSDSSTDTEDTPAIFFKHTDLPMRHAHRKKTKFMPLTDWGKIQTALADLPEAAARIFPVKRLDNNLPSSVFPQVVHYRLPVKLPALFLCISFALPSVHLGAGNHPYQPSIWTFRNFITGDVIGWSEINSPAWTVRLTDIFTRDRSGKARVIEEGTYWCPSHNPGKSYCTKSGYWFCRYWGCETIVTGNRWKPPKEDEFLKVTNWPHSCISKSTYQGKPPGNCSHLTVTVLRPQDPTWAIGRLWSVYRRQDDSIRLAPDRGTVIQIIRTHPPTRYIAVGPNELITSQKEKTLVATAEPDSVPASPRPEVASQGLFDRMLYAAFASLNYSQPNLTKSCWLCYDAKPPFYEGIGVSTMFEYSKGANPKQCKWDTSRKGITLGMISGYGLYIGSRSLATQNKQHCNTSITLDQQQSWAIPAPGSVWACHTTGITPCVSIRQFDATNDFCVQVAVIPRILYHTDDEVMLHFEARHREKRELVTAVSLAVLLTLGGTGAATGISSLVTQKQNLLQLQRAIDEDLLEIHKNILKLEESLFSLSEMVLQNRRGLDLLLMQQGGLCAALNEECCTYVNHSGPIRQSMAELKERLIRRGQEFQQRNWFDSLFSQHPWIAPVVSTLIGPVVTILLALVFGPCLLNKITQFVKARLSRIDIMLLEQRQLA
ncbi:hypothetical protein HGM15179_007756 [Zosterops borbonicus]|uniref:Envelope glycoprotein n=1 Tax=Zosterops borbonicus TaxID=364589 RepID=A0A8K1LMF0_9PASS|nr:hypothetical protein HGM15179_007756 [Zosterops borbonicus]